MEPRPFQDVDWVSLLRHELVPRLRTYPSLRLWHAGGPAAEVYSSAIVLREEGLLSRALIYATADGDQALDRLRRDELPGALDAAGADYLSSGGRASIDEYYQQAGGGLQPRPLLRDRVVFAAHSFATDASFNEFHLVICRDLDAADPELCTRAERVLRDSLCPLGFLRLAGGGAPPSATGRWLEPLRPDLGLYRRIA